MQASALRERLLMLSGAIQALEGLKEDLASEGGRAIRRVGRSQSHNEDHLRSGKARALRRCRAATSHRRHATRS